MEIKSYKISKKYNPMEIISYTDSNHTENLKNRKPIIG